MRESSDPDATIARSTPKTNQNREAEIDSNPEKPRFRDTARRRKKMKKKSRITNPPPTIDRRGRGGGARGAGITGARRSTTRAQGMEWRQSAAAVAVPGTRNCGMVGVEHSSER